MIGKSLASLGDLGSRNGEVTMACWERGCQYGGWGDVNKGNRLELFSSRLVQWKKSVASAGKSVAHAGKSVAHAGKPVAPAGKPVAPAAYPPMALR